MVQTERDRAVDEEQTYRDAMDRAGRLLGVRGRSTRELEERLTDAGYDSGVVARVIERLTELALLDDRAFARSWIEKRSARGRGPQVLLAELEARGIDPDVARDALGVSGSDERAAAIAVAAAYAPRVARLPLADQARRIYAHLARRGFTTEASEEAVKEVLPPEGWD